ncbi:MAG TPA: IclR family transcriptional regulator [Gryllotalpicola sp.]
MAESREPAGMDILGKVDAVVSTLTRNGELSAAAIAESVGEPVSSTYRLLSSLTQIGWVSQGSRRGLYRLGLFFMRVGGQVEDAIDIRERALGPLQTLLDRTGQTAYLCVRHDLRAVCIERLEGGDVRSLAMTLGATLPLVVGGAPKALLAYLPEEEFEDVLERSYATTFAERIPESRAIVEKLVEEIRASGIAVSDGDVTPGVSAIGAPVFNHRGELQAAISVSGIREHILGDEVGDHVLQAVRDCADAVSTALGWRGTVVR